MEGPAGASPIVPSLRLGEMGRQPLSEAVGSATDVDREKLFVKMAERRKKLEGETTATEAAASADSSLMFGGDCGRSSGSRSWPPEAALSASASMEAAAGGASLAATVAQWPGSSAVTPRRLAALDTSVGGNSETPRRLSALEPTVAGTPSWAPHYGMDTPPGSNSPREGVKARSEAEVDGDEEDEDSDDDEDEDDEFEVNPQSSTQSHGLVRGVVSSSPRVPAVALPQDRSTALGESPGLTPRGGQPMRATAADAGGELQDEWQFELLNSMPREKALALVDLIKSAEKERADAMSKASALQREVQELKTPRQSAQSESNMGMSPGEWQFEIMNSLPREKAVALINLLKQTEQERKQAQAIAADLQREVEELRTPRPFQSPQRDSAKVSSDGGSGSAAQAAEALVNMIKQSEQERGKALALAAQLQREVQDLKTPRMTADSVLSPAEKMSVSQAPLPPSKGATQSGDGLLSNKQTNTKLGRSSSKDSAILARGPMQAIGAICVVLLAALICWAMRHQNGEDVTQSIGDVVTKHASSNFSAHQQLTSSSAEIDVEGDVVTKHAASNLPAHGNRASSSVEIGMAASEIQTDAASEIQSQTDVKSDKKKTKRPPRFSASLVGDVKLELHHKAALSQDFTAPQDATAEFGPLLQAFPYVQAARRLGRVNLNREAFKDGRAVMTAVLKLSNDGRKEWPPITKLRLTSGAAFDLHDLPLGEITHPAGFAELTLQFDVPREPLGQEFMRSTWVLEAEGIAFGPLLILEVRWV